MYKKYLLALILVLGCNSEEVRDLDSEIPVKKKVDSLKDYTSDISAVVSKNLSSREDVKDFLIEKYSSEIKYLKQRNVELVFYLAKSKTELDKMITEAKTADDLYVCLGVLADLEETSLVIENTKKLISGLEKKKQALYNQ